MHFSTAPARLRLSKALAVGCLLLTMGCVALALWAGERKSAVQGPWGLAVLPGGQVWLSVDDALWQLDAQGRRLNTVTTAQAGLPGPAGILAAHPAGHLVAWARHHPGLHLLSADDARPLHSLIPAWPAALRRHADNAIHFAFAPDGRVAIATGGGHAVAQFGPQGQFLGQSPAGTYRFTNGLWWDEPGGGWWASDTNRPALVRLDDATLAPAQRIALTGRAPGGYFLGLAMAPYRHAKEARAPAGTVARLDNAMETGQLVDVWPDGSQTAYPLPPGQGALEPRAMARLGADVLVVDGQRFAVLRYGPGRTLLGDWGSDEVRAALAQRRGDVAAWGRWYRIGLGSAAAWFALGLLLAVRSQRLQAQARLAQVRPEWVAAHSGAPCLHIAGQPPLPAWRRLRLVVGGLWPTLLGLGLVVLAARWLLPPVLRWLLPIASHADLRTALVAAPMLALQAVMVLLVRQANQRLQTQPALEPLAAQRAQRLLARPDAFWPLCHRGEQPRETLMLGRRWLVLTNQRLLVFKTNGRDVRLLAAHPRGALRTAQATPLRSAPRLSARLLGWLLPGHLHLAVALADGSTLGGTASNAHAARRVAALLRHAPAPQPAAPIAPPARGELRRAPLYILASLLLPGTGQWLQRRAGSALVLFAAWLVLALPFAYAAWAAWWPSRDVAPAVLWQSALLLLGIHLLAALDAWYLREVQDLQAQ
ncbi:hypothetical protein [Pulveribacter suum]|uniref:Uncharacterized protein n=1 Tax=Pulveribacter suum TaxID=2116657 RepID=A0A2P1NNG6_9BURK|nr:hypothetical protein [Pulveribacter suum]AVP58599.1 hypothetical protein C7H73_13625 [Pulveribacter suum]